MTTRRNVLAFIASLPATSIANTTHQQTEWPTRPINFVVAGAPGGGLDTYARMIADMVSKELSQTVIVQNKPGANGTIAADFVVKSPADGYTFLFTNASSIVVGEALGRPKAYDYSDLQPVAQLSSGGVLLIATKRVGVTNLEQLIDYVKSHPDALYATWGVGSTGHITMEWLCQKAGISMEHVAYKSIAQIPIDMAAIKDLNFAFVDARHTAIPYVERGDIMPIAISGSGRSLAFPDTPTLEEQGYPMNADGWYGLFCSSKVDSAVVTEMNNKIRAGLRTKAMKKKLQEIYMSSPPDLTPAAFGESLKRELAIWTEAVESSKLEM